MQTAAERSIVAQALHRVPIWWWFAAVLALAIAAYSLRYAFLGEQAYSPDLAPSFRERPLTVTIHTLFGPMALLLGIVNLLPGMRRGARWPVHRWVGRVYVVSAVMLSGAGLSMAFHAAGGIGPRVAFGLLALATLGTALQGYRHRVPNALFVEWIIRRGWQPAFVLREGFPTAETARS